MTSIISNLVMINNFDNWLNESRSLSINDIENWLIAHKISKYTINSDLTVDVDGDVYLNKQAFEHFSVQFNKVRGNFFCRECNKLKSLEGSPREVGGNFSCQDCMSLTSLKGAPQKVNGYFYCRWCTILTLEGSPQEVGGEFSCRKCIKLISLKGAPRKVGGNFYCSECENLISIESDLEVIGDFYCGDTIFDKLFKNIKYQDFIKLSRDEQAKLYVNHIDPKYLSKILTPKESHKYRGVIHGNNFGI